MSSLLAHLNRDDSNSLATTSSQLVELSMCVSEGEHRVQCKSSIKACCSLSHCAETSDYNTHHTTHYTAQAVALSSLAGVQQLQRPQNELHRCCCRLLADHLPADLHPLFCQTLPRIRLECPSHFPPCGPQRRRPLRRSYKHRTSFPSQSLLRAGPCVDVRDPEEVCICRWEKIRHLTL
jgi:hypothetical protein